LGGLGMLALEGNGVHALDAMIGLPYEMEFPRVVGVCLSGELYGWASPKDVILKVLSMLSGKGAKGSIIEYFGPGAASLSATGKATICSMSSQVGALSSIFSYDGSMGKYIEATGRGELALLINQLAPLLAADAEVLNDPDKYYDQVLHINLSEIRPSVTGPHAIDRPHRLEELKSLIVQHGYPEKLSAALIGSCTNSSYEDLKRAALIARQALKHGLKIRSPLFISPGSENVLIALKQEGLLKVFEDVGATILCSSCGPCIGQWKRLDVAFGEKNAILTSFNCSAPGHCDANPGTHAFISSPEIVMVSALAGTLCFNPALDALINAQGLPVRLSVPASEPVPDNGFRGVSEGCFSVSEDGSSTQMVIDPASDRLQFLEPFKPLAEKGFLDLRLLIKVDGKCSSDHISPAGKWMKFRGHLDNISNNLFSLVPNSFRDEIGKGKNLLNNSIEPFSKVAKDYKKEDIGWIAVAGDNYGEGPSRDHAALEFRYLGGRAIIARSFAPSHELNLKKQGVLVLTFTWPEDSLKIREDDLMDLLGISHLAAGSSLELLLKHADGTTDRLPLSHSYTERQLAWFKAGSALNLI
jgi:aconitate hydratase